MFHLVKVTIGANSIPILEYEPFETKPKKKVVRLMHELLFVALCTDHRESISLSSHREKSSKERHSLPFVAGEQD